jgi:transposase
MAAISGIDWAGEHHDVRIADEHSGVVLVERRFAHEEAGIGALIDVLVEQRVTRVAIERPDGLLVGRLLAAGVTVLAIDPNQVAAARDRFRARHGYSGRRPVEELLDRLRSAPTAAIGELETEARRSAIVGLVRALRPLVEQISQLTSEIRGAIRAHPDGPIFLSFFRDPNSVVTAAGLLCEIGDNRAR